MNTIVTVSEPCYLGFHEDQRDGCKAGAEGCGCDCHPSPEPAPPADGCSHFRKPADCDDCIADESRGLYITTLVRELDGHTTGAAHLIAQAEKALRELTSDHVYDIELAETCDGSDALADLAEAARALRRVRRIIGERARLLEGEHRS